MALEVEQGSLGKEDPCSKRPYLSRNVPESVLSINTYYVCKCVYLCVCGGASKERACQGGRWTPEPLKDSRDPV